MKAIVCRAYGSPEVLDLLEQPQPIPEDDDILVRIRATAVTNSDIFIRSSRVPPLLWLPMRLAIGLTRPRRSILGLVFSGEVESVGTRISRFHPGDQVYGLTGFGLGAYAQYKCMKETDSKSGGCIARKPENLSHEEATAAAYGGLLAFQYLEKGGLRSGEKVLIYGASGTSGTLAIQQARALGAEVTGVCSTRNLDMIRSLGADKAIDYTSDEAFDSLEEYNLVLDCVGKIRTSPLRKYLEKSQPSHTRFVSVDDGNLELFSSRLDDITAGVEAGRVRPVLERSFPMDEIRAAHVYVETGHKRGGVAISVP